MEEATEYDGAPAKIDFHGISVEELVRMADRRAAMHYVQGHRFRAYIWRRRANRLARMPTHM